MIPCKQPIVNWWWKFFNQTWRLNVVVVNEFFHAMESGETSFMLDSRSVVVLGMLGLATSAASGNWSAPKKANIVSSFNHIAKKINIIFSADSFNPLSANPTKWSYTLKQFVGNLPTNCLSVLNHFVGLALKRLIRRMLESIEIIWKSERNGFNLFVLVDFRCVFVYLISC